MGEGERQGGGEHILCMERNRTRRTTLHRELTFKSYKHCESSSEDCTKDKEEITLINQVSALRMQNPGFDLTSHFM